MSDIYVSQTQSQIAVTSNPINITVSEDGVLVANLTSNVNTITVSPLNNVIEVRSGNLSDTYIRSLFSANTPLQYDAVNGIFSIDENALFSGKTTDDLTEGSTNLYYSNARVNAYIIDNGLDFNAEKVQDEVASFFTSGDPNLILTYNDVANTLVLTHTLNTSAIPEGSNLYYTQARFDSAFSAKSTSDLTEGTNLYYTTARANADFDTRLATKTTDDLAEGSNLYFTDPRVVSAILNNDITLKQFHETYVDLGNITSTPTFDLSQGTVIKATLTADINSMTFTNAVAGSSATIILQQDVTGNWNLDTTSVPANWSSWKFVGNAKNLDPSALNYSVMHVYFDGNGTVFASLSTMLAISTTGGGASQLDDLTDIDFSGATAGKALVSDGDGSYSFATLSTTLNGLTDVTITSATNGEVLKYNGSSWVNTFQTTTSVTEGTNLYYTDTRARNAISVSGDLSYDPNTGVISYTTPADLDNQTLSFNTGTNELTISGGNTVDLSSLVDIPSGNISVDSVTISTTQNIDPVQGQLAWNPDKSTLALGLNGVELNVGQDQLIYAKSTEAIDNGRVVMFAGAEGSHLLIRNADVTVPGFIDQWIIGIAKESIPQNTFGFVQVFGTITGLNTSPYSLGDILYLDPVTPGYVTTTPPAPPNHVIPLAAVTNVHVTQGEIFVRPTFGEHIGDLYDVDITNLASGDILTYDGVTGTWKNNEILKDLTPFFNGVFVGHPEVTIESNGTIVEAVLTGEGTTDIRVFWSDGVTTIDTTPPIRVTLTAGTNTAPVLNYVFIPKSTGVLTVGTYWPEYVEFVPVATILCPSAAHVQTQSVYKLHSWTDHVNSSDAKGSMGHLHHLNYWIRQQPATWHEGVSTSVNIVTQPAAVDDVYISTTAGEILQLHEQDFPAFNQATGSHVHVINHPTSPYNEITNLNLANMDSAGNVIANKQYTNLLLWGVASSDQAHSQLMINLPSGFHTSDAGALADTDGYTNYNIPYIYLGTGFLIARITLKYTNVNGGTWELIDVLDLRGATAGSIVGAGVAATGTVFSDANFRIVDDLDETKSVAFQASGLTTSTTRTLTVPDHDGTIITTSSSTTDLPEGTNLYYTDARVKTAVQTEGSTANGFYMDQVFNGTRNERQFMINNGADTNSVSVGNVGYTAKKSGIEVTKDSFSIIALAEGRWANQGTAFLDDVDEKAFPNQKILVASREDTRLENGTRVTITGVNEGALGDTINTQYYIKNHGDWFWWPAYVYSLWTDAALTVPAEWTWGAAWPHAYTWFPAGIDYSFTGTCSDYKGTEHRWDFVIPENDNAFTFRHNGNDIFSIQDTGKIGGGFTTDKIPEGTVNLYTTETNTHQFIGTYRGDLKLDTISGQTIESRDRLVQSTTGQRLRLDDVGNVDVRLHRIDNTGTAYTYNVWAYQNGINAININPGSPISLSALANGEWANATFATTLNGDQVIVGVVDTGVLPADGDLGVLSNLNFTGLTLGGVDISTSDGFSGQEYLDLLGTNGGNRYYALWTSSDLGVGNPGSARFWGDYGASPVGSSHLAVTSSAGEILYNPDITPDQFSFSIIDNDLRDDKRHYAIPDGTAVTFTGSDFTNINGEFGIDYSDVGTSFNNMVGYVRHIHYNNPGEHFYVVYTDAGMTTPVTWFGQSGRFTASNINQVAYAKTSAGGVATYTPTSNITDLQWNLRLNGNSDNLHIVSNGVDAATLTPGGTLTATAFVGDGTALTNISDINEAYFVTLLQKYKGIVSDIVDGGGADNSYDGGSSSTTGTTIIDGGAGSPEVFDGGAASTTEYAQTMDGGNSTTTASNTVDGGVA